MWFSSTHKPKATMRYRYTRWRCRAAIHLIDLCGSLLFGVARQLSRLRTRRSESGSTEPNQILVIQLDHLGDAIISLPMLRALRARYPAACIDVLCGPWNREWFESLSEIDNVRVMKFNRFTRDHRTSAILWIPALLLCAAALRHRRYDLAIDVRGELPIALLMWLCGAPHRVGWACGGGGFLLTHSAVYVPGRSEAASRWSLLRTIGVAQSQQSVDRRYDPGDAARTEIANRLEKLRCQGRRLVVLHLGAGTTAKRWPSHYWRELSQRLHVASDVVVILVGTQADQPIAKHIALADATVMATLKGQRFATSTTVLRDIHDWTGQLTLRQLAALIERASLFVGADSGPGHLAAAVATPAVVLFSGTNTVQQWQPSGDRVRVLRHEVPCAPCHRLACPIASHPCMTGLTPTTVMRACAEMLSHLPDSAPTIRHSHSIALDGAAIRRLAEPRRTRPISEAA